MHGARTAGNRRPLYYAGLGGGGTSATTPLRTARDWGGGETGEEGQKTFLKKIKLPPCIRFRIVIYYWAFAGHRAPTNERTKTRKDKDNENDDSS